MSTNKKLFNSRFLLFFVIATAVNVTQFMSNGSFSVAADASGVSASMIGVITSIVGIVSFLMMVIAGPASVSIAPHLLWGITCFGYAASYFLMSRGVMGLYIAAYAIDGFVTGFQAPAMMMILRDCVSEGNIGSAMGVYQMRNSIAKVVGPLLGLNGLCIILGYMENFLVCSGLMLLYGIIIISSMKLKETQFKPVPFRLKPQNIIVKGGLLPFLITVCLGMAQMGMGPFNTVYAKTAFGATNIGLMMSIGNLGAIFIAPQISRLSDKISPAKMLLCSLLLFAVGPVLFSIARSFAMCIVAACFQFIGFAVIASALQTLLVRNSPKKLSSVAGNTFSGGLNLGSFFGPLIAGQLATAFGYRTMYSLILIPIAAAAVLTLIYARTHKAA